MIDIYELINKQKKYLKECELKADRYLKIVSADQRNKFENSISIVDIKDKIEESKEKIRLLKKEKNLVEIKNLEKKYESLMSKLSEARQSFISQNMDERSKTKKYEDLINNVYLADEKLCEYEIANEIEKELKKSLTAKEESICAILEAKGYDVRRVKIKQSLIENGKEIDRIENNFFKVYSKKDNEKVVKISFDNDYSKILKSLSELEDKNLILTINDNFAKNALKLAQEISIGDDPCSYKSLL